MVLVLTLVGIVTLVFMAKKYYWAGRGAPPPTGEEKRRLKEEELRLRAKQIERSKKHPIATRKPDFWDNSKVYKDSDIE